MAGRLEGKRALITGGTRGIGLAVAERFCEEGAWVVVAGRPEGRGEGVATKLRAKGHTAFFESIDLADAKAIPRMVGRAAALLWGIDTLVNNAGISARGTIAKLDMDLLDRAYAINLRAPLASMHAVRPHMPEGGSIINISSIAGIDAPFGSAAYAATKAGIIAASAVAAKEFGRRRVRVNTIAPGVIETDMTSSIPEDRMQDFRGQTPLGRTGMPEEIANACVYLASNEASFVTGAVLRVDGGLRF